MSVRHRNRRTGCYREETNGWTAGRRLRRRCIAEQIASERRSTEEQLQAQADRHDEARASIARIADEQRAADEQLNGAQRRLFDAREAMQAQARVTAEAKAAHAGLVERASGLAIEVQRLEDAARELEARVTARQEDLERTNARQAGLRERVTGAEQELDAGLRSFDELREHVRMADDRSQSLRADFDAQESGIKEARRALESVRGEAAQLDVARATGGAVTAVTEEEIVDGIELLARTTGIFTETAGGVTTATLARLAAAGAIDPDERVVVYITGDGLKTLDAVASRVARHPIEPTVASFEAAIGEARLIA